MATFTLGQLYSREPPPPPPVPTEEWGLVGTGAICKFWRREISFHSSNPEPSIPYLGRYSDYDIPTPSNGKIVKIVKAVKDIPNGSVSGTYHCNICLERLKKTGKTEITVNVTVGIRTGHLWKRSHSLYNLNQPDRSLLVLTELGFLNTKRTLVCS